MVEQTDVQVYIDGAAINRSAVSQWESRRAEAVLKKLGSKLGPRAVAEILGGTDLGAVANADLEARRATLLALKTGLGPAGMYAILDRELAMSEHMSRLAVKTSGGRSAVCKTRVVAHGISAKSFGAWFEGLTATNAVEDLVGSCPDHYLIRGLPDGRQEVVETTGGSPMPTRFIVDYGSGDSVPVPALPGYPIQVAGQAVLDDGLAIGGVRHQFRDVDGSMEALLAVAFPRTLPPWMVAAHRWHLAVEFGNWISRCRQISAGAVESHESADADAPHQGGDRRGQ